MSPDLKGIIMKLNKLEITY